MNGDNMEIHHIGYAVRDINKSLDSFTKMGFHLIGDITHDTIRKVDICFIEDVNNKAMIELIAPYETGSDVDGALKKWGGPAPYHMCYEVDNIEEFLASSGKSLIVIKKPEIAPAINNKRVAFLYHKDMGLFEIVEK